MYYESIPTMPGTHGHTGENIAKYCSAPMGVAIFKHEPFATKVRSWVEASSNVKHWREFGEGGHFAALEEPAALAADLLQLMAVLAGHER